MIKNVVTLSTSRTGYSINQIIENSYNPMTIGMLKEILETYEDDDYIVFKNDNGYTYGQIKYDSFDCEEITICRNPDDIAPEQKYRISGDADEIFSDSPFEGFVDSEVTILDFPDESGWVLARVHNVDGCHDYELFVDIDELIDI